MIKWSTIHYGLDVQFKVLFSLVKICEIGLQRFVGHRVYVVDAEET